MYSVTSLQVALLMECLNKHSLHKPGKSEQFPKYLETLHLLKNLLTVV